MDPQRFDSLTRTFDSSRSRRSVVAGLAGFAAAAFGMRAAGAEPVICPTDQTANARGKCSCPAGTDPCPEGCFDKKRDPLNCGTCGNYCALGGVCQKGKCACPSGTTLCDGACLPPEQCESGCRTLFLSDGTTVYGAVIQPTPTPCESLDDCTAVSSANACILISPVEGRCLLYQLCTQ